MRDSIKNLKSSTANITDLVTVHNAVAIAASASSDNAFVDVEGFDQAVVLVDMTQSFDVTCFLSDNNVDSYFLSTAASQSSGKRAYVYDIRGVKYLNVKILNKVASAATLTMKILLSS